MLVLKTPELTDMTQFLSSVEHSQSLHYPWVQPPNDQRSFEKYIEKTHADNHAGYLIINSKGDFIGVYNINDIVRGCFDNGYLGFYAFVPHADKGLMSEAMKLVLDEAFNTLKLHRLEANIQPDNTRSIHLVLSNGFLKEGFSKNYLKVHGVWRDHERFARTQL